MPGKPVGLDHVDIYVRNAERSHRWYTDVLAIYTLRQGDGKADPRALTASMTGPETQGPGHASSTRRFALRFSPTDSF